MATLTLNTVVAFSGNHCQISSLANVKEVMPLDMEAGDNSVQNLDAPPSLTHPDQPYT